MAEREASGEFDYSFDHPTGADDFIGDDPLPEQMAPEDFDYALRDDDQWDEPDDDVWSNEPDVAAAGSFDAFDTNTWFFEPAPTPWYRTKQAMTALIAAAAAAAAIVVSGVLLVVRVPGTVDSGTTSVAPTAPTAPTTAAPTRLATSAPPPPPERPPPPPETTAAPVEAAPAETYRPRRPSPRTTKEPEIGVTRTPATRSPISVAPQRPGNLR
ncbi:MAG TPA: hypothetical protein VHI10_02290 [Mycobacterium sp.]|nr:hypothetical protein [Mycobacterium sp.]